MKNPRTFKVFNIAALPKDMDAYIVNRYWPMFTRPDRKPAPVLPILKSSSMQSCEVVIFDKASNSTCRVVIPTFSLGPNTSISTIDYDTFISSELPFNGMSVIGDLISFIKFCQQLTNPPPKTLLDFCGFAFYSDGEELRELVPVLQDLFDVTHIYREDIDEWFYRPESK